MKTKSKKQIQELERIQAYLKEIDLASYVQKREDDVTDSLVIELTAKGSRKKGDFRPLVCNFLPLPLDRAEFTEFLHCSMDIPFDVTRLSKTDLLIWINRLNSYSALGHFIYSDAEENEPAKISIRAILPFSEGVPMDLVAFRESILLLLDYEDSMESILIKLLQKVPETRIIKDLEDEF